MRRAALTLGAQLLTFLMMGGCAYERPTVVSVTSGPSFGFRGSGRLAAFAVYAPRSDHRIALSDPVDSKLVWQIQATQGYFEGTHVENLQLNYGKVPNGYTQVVPLPPQAAPPLPLGAVYAFWAETSGAPIAAGFFYMDKAGPIQTYIPDLCQTLENGREVRVRCSFSGDRTYHEPKNLEEIVRKYQIKDTSEAERIRESFRQPQEPCEPEPAKGK